MGDNWHYYQMHRALRDAGYVWLYSGWRHT